MSNRLLFGVGINDADYVVQPSIQGRQVVCLFYDTWRRMLRRCYNNQDILRNPTYADCTVCEEWKTFSNFRKWMETQDWLGKQLDKDILYPDNKLYSPDTCVFVSQAVNKFCTERAAKRGQWMLGVYWHKRVGKFAGQCNDGTGKHIHLGYYTCELDAHLAWKMCKHTIACRLADEQADLRVAAALRQRYL